MMKNKSSSQHKPNPLMNESTFGAKPWVAHFALLAGFLSVILAIIRYPYYPVTSGAFGIYFGSLVLRTTKATVSNKLIAKIGVGLGAIGFLLYLALILIRWLTG